MKPMNRMEALLMGDKTLTPETRQEAMAQYVGGKLGGKKLVFSYEVTEEINNEIIDMKPFRDIIDNDKNFVIEIVYDYYNMLHRASISRHSGTIKKGEDQCGFSGCCKDEWGENLFICLTNEQGTPSEFSVTAEASGGTFKRFDIYEIV